MKMSTINIPLIVAVVLYGSCEEHGSTFADQVEIIEKSQSENVNSGINEASAAQFNFRAHLGGDEEVPAVDMRAQGQATFKVNSDGTSITYRLIVSNIENVLMAHMHLAPAGENGDIVVWLYPSSPPSQLIEGRFQGVLTEGTFTSEDLVGSLEGQTLNDLTEAMKFGYVHVNVHTSQHGSEEIRGQIFDGHEPKLWLTRKEIESLPTEGESFENVINWAHAGWDADISDQDNRHNAQTYAAALLCTRGVDLAYCYQTIQGIKDAIGTEEGGRTLALGRNLAAYVIAADLIGYREEEFVNWLDGVRTAELSSRAGMRHLEDSALRDPSNWGNHARASMIAAAHFLSDKAQLDLLANRFHDWAGRSSQDWEFRIDWSWHADPDNSLGINPEGAIIDGHNVDGVLPDDFRRCGEFRWPPCKTGYSWEGLQGVVVSAELLRRAGYPAWEWELQAVLRSVTWLYNTTFDDGQNDPAVGDDRWQPWLIDYAYGTDFAAERATQPGKNMGFTDWTYGDRTRSDL